MALCYTATYGTLGAVRVRSVALIENKKRIEDMIKSTLVNKIVETESVHDYLTEKGMMYTYLNPVSYLTALKEKALFGMMDGIFADGSLLVQAIRLVYGVRVTRRSFDMTSMAPEVLAYANEKGLSVCVIATRQEMLERTLRIFAAQYPKIEWRGCRNGYFATRTEMEEEARKIAEADADYLIVGMGIKMQERFLLMCKKAGYKGIGFTCGGFIHQTAEQAPSTGSGTSVDYYPAWVDRFNLRFFYRMYKEPHTRKRYAIATFAFPYQFLKERIRG